MPARNQFKKRLLVRRLEGFAVGSRLGFAPTAAAIAALGYLGVLHLPSPVLAVWIGAAAAIMCARAIVARLMVPADLTLTQLERKWREANAVLVAGSLLWAVSLPLAVWTVGAAALPELAAIATAVFCGVLLLHRTAPAAAIFHVASTGCGLAAMFWIAENAAAWPIFALIVVFAGALISAILLADRQLQDACHHQLAREDSEQTVLMLLNDHEAQVADWQWSTDAAGRLRGVSEELAAVMGAPAIALEATELQTLFEPGRERSHIVGCLANRKAFRNVPVQVMANGELRAWQLSGHPTSDGGMSGVGRDVTDRQDIEERVRTMAYADPLTGLANRHKFNQRLRELLGEDGPPGRAALFYLDLDEFKAVNDLHGHMVGDALLREMAGRLLRESAAGDTVARLGGDEFAVLVDSASGDGIMIERAHRLLAAAREPFHIDGQVARISTSIGFARADASCDAVELLRRVDLALYAAKAKGRDQIALFDDALDRRERERRALEQELRDALTRDEMVLHYQPIISLGNGATVGYEALLRWRHPRLGLLRPDRFLSIAEESGMIMALGDWVIGQALADVAQWEGDFRLALNLSPSQIRSPQLVAAVDSALAAARFPASRLEFEITEHVLLNDAEAGTAVLSRLRALGAEIALDDFGTGYSSLSYLRRFRFDRIKIDRTFVRDIESSAEAQAIVSAITRLALALGMKTTAEGVERKGQLDLLRKLGCDEAQGFLILKPTEAGEIDHGRRLAENFTGETAALASYRAARAGSGMGPAQRRG